MAAYSILIAGESWMTHSIHVKGFDSFTTSTYEEGVEYLKNALEQSGFAVTFLPNHLANREFPLSIEELDKFNLVILSDIGVNTLLLHPETFENSKSFPNRLKLIREYVHSGGGLIMIGGYLSFQGIEAKAGYKDTPIEEILPVNLFAGDDRMETPQGCKPYVKNKNHPCVKGLTEDWPMILGFNKLIAKEDSEVIVECEGFPFLVVRSVGKGRTAAFASDCGPHWAPPGFVEWEGYAVLWGQIAGWVAGIES